MASSSSAAAATSSSGNPTQLSPTAHPLLQELCRHIPLSGEWTNKDQVLKALNWSRSRFLEVATNGSLKERASSLISLLQVATKVEFSSPILSSSVANCVINVTGLLAPFADRAFLLSVHHGLYGKDKQVSPLLEVRGRAGEWHTSLVSFFAVIVPRISYCAKLKQDDEKLQLVAAFLMASRVFALNCMNMMTGLPYPFVEPPVEVAAQLRVKFAPPPPPPQAALGGISPSLIPATPPSRAPLDAGHKIAHDHFIRRVVEARRRWESILHDEKNPEQPLAQVILGAADRSEQDTITNSSRFFHELIEALEVANEIERDDKMETFSAQQMGVYKDATEACHHLVAAMRELKDIATDANTMVTSTRELAMQREMYGHASSSVLHMLSYVHAMTPKSRLLPRYLGVPTHLNPMFDDFEQRSNGFIVSEMFGTSQPALSSACTDFKNKFGYTVTSEVLKRKAATPPASVVAATDPIAEEQKAAQPRRSKRARTDASSSNTQPQEQDDDDDDDATPAAAAATTSRGRSSSAR